MDLGFWLYQMRPNFKLKLIQSGLMYSMASILKQIRIWEICDYLQLFSGQKRFLGFYLLF